MTQVPRVVFDCNVFLQALGAPQGPSGRCLQLAFDRVVMLFVSPRVMEELRDVAGRPRVAARLRLLSDRLEGALTAIEIAATSLENFDEPFVYDRDPDDAHYINLALAAGAEFIISRSRDRDLLDLSDSARPESRDFRERYPNLTVVDPVKFQKRFATRI